jgi:hypothetical protein
MTDKKKSERIDVDKIIAGLKDQMDKGISDTRMSKADVIELAQLASNLVDARNALADVGRQCEDSLRKRSDDVNSQAPFVSTLISIGAAIHELDSVLEIHDVFIGQVYKDMNDHKGCGDCEGCRNHAAQQESESSTVH